jgi:hypothetical protein
VRIPTHTRPPTHAPTYLAEVRDLVAAKGRAVVELARKHTRLAA